MHFDSSGRELSIKLREGIFECEDAAKRRLHRLVGSAVASLGKSAAVFEAAGTGGTIQISEASLSSVASGMSSSK